MPDPIRIEAFDRSYLINDPGGRIGSFIATGHPYERALLYDIYNQKVAGKIKRKTAFDIGAHVGNHSLFMAMICQLRVVAWEPFPRFREQLEDNLALNPGLTVRVYGWAAGDRYTNGVYREGMKIQLDRGDIKVAPIDDVIDEPVGVVKIDVEGMEPQVLAGMGRHLKRYRPIIYAEAHTAKASTAIGKVITPLGYQLTARIQMGSTMERWEWMRGG